MPFNSTNKPIVPNINEDNFTQFIPEPTMAVYDDPMPQPEDTSKYGFGYEIKQDLASIPESNSFLGKAYRINFYTPQDWHNDALKYAQKLNMNPDVLMNAGMGAIEQARAVSNQIDRRQAAGMYQDMPELETIRYGSTAEALDALQHVASVNSTRGIWDSIQQNVWSINDQMKLGEAGYELAETDDPDKKKSLLAEINRLQNNLQQYRTESNSLAESLVGGTIGQVAMMGSQALKGLNRAAEGAAIGAGIGAASGSLAGGIGAIPGAIAGFITGGSVGAQTGMAEQMYHMSMGNKYIEYMQKKDSNGNNIYTPSEAKAYAMSFGAVDTAIEFAALRGMGKAISAAKPATSAIGDIVGGVTKEATLDTGIGTSAARAFKAGIKTSLAETSEEGLQDVDEKLQHNLFRKDNDPEGVYSLSDIGEGAIGAMWQALPSVVGLGALGGLAGGIRSANAFRQWHNMTPEERELMVHQQQNAVGNQIIRELAKDSKAQELNNNNPELYQKIVQAQGERAGISHAYINANELVDTEEGQQVINHLVDSGIVTAKDVEESIANNAPMEMPIGKFAQVAQDFDEPIKQAIEKVTFYNKAGISQEGIKRAVETANTMRERMADNKEEQRQKLANDIVDSKFSDLTPEQQETVKAVFSDNPYDVKGSYARLYNALNESYREDYNTDYQTLHAENQDASNRPNWYSEYVNNNGKAPDIAAMRRIAYEEGRKRSTDIVDKALLSVGTENNDINTAVKTSLNAGLAMAKKPNQAKNNAKNYVKGNIETTNNDKNNAKNGLNTAVNNLENLTKVSDNTGVNNYYDEMGRRLNELETLDAMRERIYKVADSDIFLRDGLSKEALDVYNDIKGIFKQSNNLAVKKQAEHGALLFASHSDAMANIMRQAGRTEFTAMDYYKQYVNIQTGGNYNGVGFTQEESKIETPAFKKWFAKSKVVDEQGNPIVLYHGGVNNTWSIYDGEKKSKESYNTYANSNSIYLTNNKNIAETYMPNVVVSSDNLDEHKNNINNLQFPSTSRLFYETAFYPTIANKKKGVKPVDVTVVLKPSNTSIDVDFIKIKGVEGKFSADEAIKQIKSMGGKITLKHNFTGVRDLYYNEDYNHNLKNLKHTSIFTGTDLISAKTLADKIFGIKKSIYTFNTRIGSVRAFYAKIENPFVVDLMGQNGNVDGIKDSKGKRWGYRQYNGDKKTALQAIEEYARNSDKKYDGVIVKNVEDIGSDTTKDANGNVYIVFSNKNIKSINNNGNFDANNPNIYAQIAYHGTGAIFDKFDLSKAGTGAGQAHGAGIYFAKNKGVANVYKKELKKVTGKGVVKKVDIPNDDELLIEDEPLKHNTKKVLDGLSNAIKSLTPNQKKIFIDAMKKMMRNFRLTSKYSKNSTKIDNINYVVDALNKISSKEKINKITIRSVQSIISRDFDTPVDDIKLDNPDVLQKYLKKYQEQLDELKDKQKELVKNGEAKNPISEEMLNKNPEKALLLTTYPPLAGKDIYRNLTKALDNDMMATSELLSKNGIQGITYTDLGDGKCFVVFSPDAIKLLREYQQKNIKNVRGTTAITADDKKLVELFAVANFSTFIHESGHVFLEDLRMLANMEGAPKQVIEDWQAVKSWTGYIEGADGDTNRNAHEKFAKGFEAYVRTGNAPTKALQRAFRQFKQWLVSLYRSVRQLGGNPPKEIRDVMDRMLAVQKDIDAWAGERELEAFENTKLFTALNEEDKASINDLVASIKEKAKEKVMNTYEKEVREHPLESFNANKLEIQLNIEAKLAEQYPIYKIRQNIEILGEQSALADTPYKTINELEDAEKREGIGIWSDAVKDEMKKAKEEYLNPDITDEDIKQMAENYINSSNGQLKLTIAETNAIQRMADREIAKNWSTISKLDKIDLDAEDVREQLSKLAEDDTNVDIANEGVQTKEVKDALKAERQQNIKNLRALRDLHINSAQELRQQAIEALNSTKIGMATSFKTHQRQAIVQARAADNAMSRGRMTEAFRHKQKQLLHQSMAVVAYENDVLVRKINKRLKANLVRMTRPKKPIMVNPDARYYINKIMYNLGMTRQEAIEPVDGFNMDTINKMLDPDADLLGEESQAQIDGIFQMAFEGKNTNWRNFTLGEFKSLDQLLQGLYTAGKRQYMGTTILDDHGKNISFEKASSEMCEQLYNRFRQKGDLLNEKNAETWTSKGLGTVGSYILDLTKTEVLLKRFDDNKAMGVWWRYVYRPIDTATKKGKVMLEKATRELADTCRTYTQKEMWAIRNERTYTIGNIHNLTKEQVITAALNWGTETNRQRVIDTFNAEAPVIEKAFAQYLDDKDWEFIIKTWAQINQYFNERSSVQERLYGTPMKKEKGITFSIGNRKIEGQYYPIVYDPKLDSAAKDYAVEDIVRSQLSSNAVWGSGMSATKQRSNIVKEKKLLLSFDVIPRAIEEAVNHVAMREACVDVNRLLADRNIQKALVNTVGVEVYQSMKNWVRDNWQLEIARMGTADKIINAFKKNAVTATMAYRVSTALLNVLNVIPAIHKVGLLPTIRSLCTFYSPGNYKENRQRVMNLSIFMRERINNLDRDLQKGLTIGGKSYDFTDAGLKQSISKGKFISKQVADKVNAYGYWSITETDFMLSLPIWAQEYDRKRAELIKQGHLEPLFVQQEAVASADRVVREIWGSGDTKDSPSMMRRKHGWTQLFTPFYTYSNTVLNALISAGYEGVDKGNWGSLISAMFYWVVAEGMAEGLIRSLWDNDDDIETLIPKMGKEVLGNTVQGFPIVRDAFSAVASAMFGESFTGRSTNVVAMSGIDKLQQTIKEAKGDNWIDSARSATEVGNRLVGFSDTITDAFWTLIKWGLTDVNTTTKDVAKAMLFDKKLKDARDIAKQQQVQKTKLNNQRKKKDGDR